MPDTLDTLWIAQEPVLRRLAVVLFDDPQLRPAPFMDELLSAVKSRAASTAPARPDELIRFAAGELLARAWELYDGPLRGMLRRQVWSEVEVDELMQGAATRSVERIGELIDRPRPLFGWLCQLVRQQRVDWLRTRTALKRSAPTAPLALHFEVADTGTTPTQAERRTRVREMFDQVLGQLDAADADLLRLQVVAHLTPTEIAARLRITPENARIQLFRARGKAAAAWQALFPEAAAELRAVGVLPAREQLA